MKPSISIATFIEKLDTVLPKGYSYDAWEKVAQIVADAYTAGMERGFHSRSE